ncbi:MAG: hypothetical protein WKF82_04215 [Nocardioidaceae bacterium]
MSIVLKGKAEPVSLWRAGRVLSGVGGAQRIDGLEAPFVGRDPELRLVKELVPRLRGTPSTSAGGRDRCRRGG